MLDRQEQLQDAEPGDHERFSHYVRKEKIMESALTGEPVVALCGKAVSYTHLTLPTKRIV